MFLGPETSKKVNNFNETDELYSSSDIIKHNKGLIKRLVNASSEKGPIPEGISFEFKTPYGPVVATSFKSGWDFKNSIKEPNIFNYIKEFFSKNNYKQIEFSVFAKPKDECLDKDLILIRNVRGLNNKVIREVLNSLYNELEK